MKAAKENEAVTAEQWARESIRIARVTRELLILGKHGGGGVFLLEVQYSILKSLISTCVLSYVGSREDWLLDRICES